MQYLRREKATMVSLSMANELLRELRGAATTLRELGQARLADGLSWQAGRLAEALLQAEESETGRSVASKRSEFWLG